MENLSIKDRLLACSQIINVTNAQVRDAGKNLNLSKAWHLYTFYKDVISGDTFLQQNDEENEILIYYEKFDKWLVLSKEMSEKMVRALEMQSALLEDSLNKKLRMKI